MVTTLDSVEYFNTDQYSTFSKDIQEKLDLILQQGPPQYRKSEDWKYTDIRNVLSLDFSSLLKEQSDKNFFQLTSEEIRKIDSFRISSAKNLVFIDGVFSGDYSDEIPSNFSCQRSKDENFFQQIPIRAINYFAALSFLYARYGMYFSERQLINDTALSKQLIHCIFFSREKTRNINMIYNQICLNENTQAEIWITYLGKGNSVSYIEVCLEKGAKLTYRQIFGEDTNSTHINHTAVIQKENSDLQSFQMAVGGGLTRSSVYVIQQETRANARIDSLYAIREKECVDFAIDVIHEGFDTVSRQLCKGILLGASRFIYRSKVEVAPNAKNIDANQENKNLLLGEDARVDARPQLDILHDAVKCAHGSAIGQLDDEQLFYLRSRAISLTSSKKILSQGFVQEVYQIHPFTLDEQLFLKSILDKYFFDVCDFEKEG